MTEFYQGKHGNKSAAEHEVTVKRHSEEMIRAWQNYSSDHLDSNPKLNRNLAAHSFEAGYHASKQKSPWVPIDEIPEEWKDGRDLDIMVSNSIHDCFGKLDNLLPSARWCSCVFNSEADEFHHPETKTRINEVFVFYAMLPPNPPKEA